MSVMLELAVASKCPGWLTSRCSSLSFTSTDATDSLDLPCHEVSANALGDSRGQGESTQGLLAHSSSSFWVNLMPKPLLPPACDHAVTQLHPKQVA